MGLLMKRAEGPRVSVSPGYHKSAYEILIIGLVTSSALWLGRRFTLFGPAIIGMLLGFVLRNMFGIGADFKQATVFCTKRMLKLAIILLGSTFTLQQATSVGKEYILVIVSTIAISLVLPYLAGRYFGVPPTLAGLIGTGTAICGVTAILTVGPVIQAKDEEIAYAVTTIFVFNLIATILYPAVGHLLRMSQSAFGAWAGTAIHDTSSVLAVAYAYGDQAGYVATVVKLVRTVFLVPLVSSLLLASVMRNGNKKAGVSTALKAFPVFIFGFLAMSGLSSLGFISSNMIALLARLGKLLIVVVLVAVGLSSDLRKLRTLGVRPLVVGLVASVVAALTSISLLAI